MTSQTPTGRYGADAALWTQQLYTFTCGACASSVTALSSLSQVESVMRLHYKLCPADQDDRDELARTRDALRDLVEGFGPATLPESPGYRRKAIDAYDRAKEMLAADSRVASASEDTA